MMQTWVAIAILICQGVLLLIARNMVKKFGDFVDVVVLAQRQNLKIRENMAIQENDYAIAHMHRRHDDPPLEQETA